MLEITVLASGSSGNATLVRCGGTSVLIDAGISTRRLIERLTACDIPITSLDGILLTHEHSDHCGALPVLLSKHHVPLFLNAHTARALTDSGVKQTGEWNIFSNGQTFTVKDLTVRPFSVPHDAADPVGFRLSSAVAHFGVLTDLGYPTRAVFDALTGIHGLLIETNHDEEMLQRDTRRPWSVKQRISSRHGHLSNSAAARAVGGVVEPGIKDCDPRPPQQGLQQPRGRAPDDVCRALATRPSGRGDSLRRSGRFEPGLSLHLIAPAIPATKKKPNIAPQQRRTGSNTAAMAMGSSIWCTCRRPMMIQMIAQTGWMTSPHKGIS